MRIVTIRYGSLGVVDVGVGDPVVLLHGFPLDHSMWNAQIDTLSGTHRVIAPDLRGHGMSDVSTEKITMRAMADDVANLLDALQVQDPITLCGLSMGGYVAWEFWRYHRHRLSRLVLCDTRAAADAPEVARARQMMAAQVMAEGAGVAADSMLPKLLAPANYQENPELVEQVRRLILGTDPRTIAAAQRGMAEREDMTDRLAEIDLPTLIVCGADDPISTPGEMQAIAAQLPHAAYTEITGAGHLPPLERPTATTAAIEKFLRPAC